jgi:hypothetical protein
VGWRVPHFHALVFSAVLVLYSGIIPGCSGPANRPGPYSSEYAGLLVYVPEGSFQRDGNKKNVVVIENGFFMMDKEVTASQFYAVMDDAVPCMT